MGERTTIEWTRGDDGSPGATWNPVTGCTKVSPGCDHCYAKKITERFHGKGSFAQVTLHPDRLALPLRWRRPRRIFVNSMSDVFHDDIPDAYIARVFAVMALAPQHTFQVLTKRHGRMRALLSSATFRHLVAEQGRTHHIGDQKGWLRAGAMLGGDPLPNVWLGVSVEDQRWADIRIPALLETPATVRYISAEPLLGPVSLHRYLANGWGEGAVHNPTPTLPGALPTLDWVIVGGESGPGARPMHPDWARRLRDQCASAGVPFLFKQWGEHLPISVVDDPNFASGRAYDVPGGGRRAAVIRERAPETNHFRGGSTRPMEPGDITSAGQMLDRDVVALRVGKRAAGRELDGRTYDQYPQVANR